MLLCCSGGVPPSALREGDIVAPTVGSRGVVPTMAGFFGVLMMGVGTSGGWFEVFFGGELVFVPTVAHNGW